MDPAASCLLTRTFGAFLPGPFTFPFGAFGAFGAGPFTFPFGFLAGGWPSPEPSSLGASSSAGGVAPGPLEHMSAMV